MASLNKVMLIGNLGRDPEVRAVSSGAKVANFSIATTESYTDRNNQRQEKTEWHRIVMWRGLADIAERFLRKGSQVFIEGKLQTRSWDDNTGQKRYTTEIVADNMVMLGGRRDGGQGGGDFGGGSSQPAYSGGGNSGGFDSGNSGGYGNSGGSSFGGDSGGFGGGSSSATPPPPPEDDLPF